MMDLHDFADVALNYDHFLPEVAKGTYYQPVSYYHGHRLELLLL